MILHKSFDCQFKSLEDNGSFSVYFAAFNNIDRQGDIIQPDAFTNLSEFSTDGWIALSHDAKALAVAYPTKAIQDATGLLVDGVFHTTPEAQACRTVVKERLNAGKRVMGSIGYRITQDNHEIRDGQPVHIIEKLEVYECSFVNLPANPAAEAVEVKEMAVATENKLISLDEFKDLLSLRLKSGPMEEDAYNKCMKACDDMEEHGRKCIKMSRKFRKDMEAHDPHTADDDEDEHKPDKDADGDDDGDKGDEEEETEKRATALRLKALKSRVRVARP